MTYCETIPTYGVVALVERKMLMTRWWSVTIRSKNVNMARRCWISQVTRVILAKVNPGSAMGNFLKSQYELAIVIVVLVGN
ncbi:hypothetical protein Csa_021001 [Cucumis sativus]|uniref:Uncharacterized protein n=1 Tax=Cucumis sativus TaxID=3659 RepID=A0A0A0KBJ6_CUCSA|nr:hypothetical protein Csa_021001 [Cucumis sativus]